MVIVCLPKAALLGAALRRFAIGASVVLVSVASVLVLVLLAFMADVGIAAGAGADSGTGGDMGDAAVGIHKAGLVGR